MPSIIPPEHTGIISEAVEARAGVLPSELLQLSFGALLKMGTVFADCRASEPSVARRATGLWRGRAAARPDSACVGPWSMGAGRRSVRLSREKE